MRSITPNSNSDLLFRSQFDIIHFLFKEGVWDLNCSDDYGNTPLHIACLSGDLNIVRIITGFADCNLNVKNRDGNTPVQLAHEKGYVDIVKELVNICHICFIQILESISHKEELDDTDLREKLYWQHFSQLGIQKTWNPNHQDKFGNTLLHYACLSGDTPLHIACLSDNTQLIKFLVNEVGCDVNSYNSRGDTPLHTACLSDNTRLIKFLVNDLGCDVNSCNRIGDTLLHTACLSDNTQLIKCLVNDLVCDVNSCNSRGDTPLQTACLSGSTQLIKCLVNDLGCDVNSCNSRGDTPLQTACLSDNTQLIKFLVNDLGFDVNSCNRRGDTPLHTACHTRNINVVRFLLSVVNCNIQNADGDTPLHIACKAGNSTVTCLICHSKCNDNSQNSSEGTPLLLAHENCIMDIQNHDGDTPLTLACHDSNQLIVQQLINTNRCNINHQNKDGNSPLHIACRNGNLVIVKALLTKNCNIILTNRQGETPALVAFNHQQPDILRLLITEEHCEYLIDLLEMISKEKWPDVVKILFSNRKVPTFSSSLDVIKHLVCQIWNINCLDESGNSGLHHACYYGHAGLVQFLVEDQKFDIMHSNSSGDTPLHTACLQGHSEVAKAMLSGISSMKTSCKPDIPNNEGDTPLHIACTSFGCHVLHALFCDKFKDRVACTVSMILTCIHSDDAHDTGNLIHLLKTLSDYGDILLLLNRKNPQKSWVILDKSVLLSELNGTVFAPEHFERRYKGFLMSTGVVPLSKIQEAFPKYDTEMISSFLIQLEFCQEVKDPDALGGITATHRQLTQSTAPSAVTERYFFFPALVNLEKPTDVWKDNEAIHYSCGWLLQCIKPDKFLTSQFIHVLLLRLAFSYALTPESHHYPEDPSYPVLLKQCSVWKNGIQWFSRACGIETIVEVREQTKLVAILMRCPDKAEIECAKLRSSVIEKVLSVQNEFCPAVTPMAECLIHPNDVQYPLPSTQELKLFSHKGIAQLVIANPEENEHFVIQNSPNSAIDTQKLLSFEPYLGLGEALVQQLFSDKDADKTVSETFLNKVAERVYQRMLLFQKMLNISENEFAECYGQAPVRQCCYLFKLWSQQRDKATYKSLRKEFDRYSIFHGRNPLVSFHYGLILLLVHTAVDKQMMLFFFYNRKWLGPELLPPFHSGTLIVILQILLQVCCMKMSY